MKAKIFIVLCASSFGLTGCIVSAADRDATQSVINSNIIATSDAIKTESALEKANQPTRTPGASSSSSSGASSSSSCVEYNSPYQVVFIDGVADVYGGVDEPSSSIKGTITGGAAGIEAKCGSFYRLKGVDWWGWVRISDTYK